MSSNRQDVTTAELGQVDPRSSIDGDESTSLLPTQRQQQPSGNNNNGKRLNTTSNVSSRSLSEKARKKIIITLTSISGALLVILALTLVGKVGAPSGMWIHALFISDDQRKAFDFFLKEYISHLWYHLLLRSRREEQAGADQG